LFFAGVVLQPSAGCEVDLASWSLFLPFVRATIEGGEEENFFA
jgi:hypothetical protein